METSVINSIIEIADNALIESMQTLIDADDKTRAGLVRAGLLQDDPAEIGIAVLTHQNDPDDEFGWDNSVVDGPQTNLNQNIPSYVIGGGEMWFYRFTTTISQFWEPNTDRISARRYAAIVLNRAMHTLRHLIYAVAVDDFGNTPMMTYVVQSRTEEAGGGDQFIWRTKIRWQVLINTDAN